jgi:penicillin-binding protein 1A
VNGDDRSLERKIKDIALASQLEQLKTKDQILELYLKHVYFGEGAFGLASAAEVYFGKEIGDLTLGEAAILARCVRRPSDENPVANYDRALLNRDVVLKIMLEEGMITDSEYADATAEKPKVRKNSIARVTSKSIAPYFVDYIFRTVREEMPDIKLSGGGYRVETTIRVDIQNFAEASVKKWVARHARDRVREGCFVLVNTSGEIIAMVGGTDYKKDQFNTVTMGRRPPGSSFKPIVYATAMQTGKLMPGQMVSNAPINLPDGRGKIWSPKNSGSWNGSAYPLSTAFAYSINRPAIWASFDAGRDTVVTYAKDRFGIRSPLQPVASLALGPIGVRPIEMAEAYSVFALKGDRVHPFGIRKIIDSSGNSVYVGRGRRYSNVLDTWVADAIDDLMQEVVQRGTAKAARVVPNARGKTGTTNDNRDAWFCGYSDNLIGVAWVGSRQNESMSASVFGGTVAVQFWVEILNFARNAYGPTGTKAEPGPKTNVLSTAQSNPQAREVRRPEPAPDQTSEPESRTEDRTDVPTEPVPGERTSDEPRPVEPKPAEPKPDELSKEKPEELLEVELCAESLAKANPFCPATITRKMRASTAPRRNCPIHHSD